MIDATGEVLKIKSGRKRAQVYKIVEIVTAGQMVRRDLPGNKPQTAFMGDNWSCLVKDKEHGLT